MRTLLSALGLLGVIVVAVPPARANDTVVTGAGGSWQPLHGEHPSIRMVSEKVAINVYADSYAVTADFVFRNLGKKTTVSMGFPESGGGDITPATYDHRSGFKSFHTSVDGKFTAVRRTPTKHTEEGYDALWVKQVGFGRGQTRRVRVEYRSAQGARSDGSRFMTYDFTGGNWRGDVSESVLTVRFHTPSTYLYSGDLVLHPSDENSAVQHNVLHPTRNNTLTLRRTHWQAQAAFSCEYTTNPPNALEATPWTPSAKNPIVTVPLGKGDTLDGKYFSTTTLGLQQGNTTFVNLQRLRDAYEDSFHNGAGAKIMLGPEKSPITLTWDAHDNSLLIAFKNRNLRFWATLNVARRETGAMVPLVAKPLHLSNRLSNIEWYVPLQPVLQMMGATAIVKPQQHLLSIQLPKK